MSRRYETAIATGIAVLAVAVSAYTAYVQRQQVRAQVWPILEINSGNEPEIRIWVANKGVGPAIVRSAHVAVHGKPVTTWKAMLEALYGPGHYSYSQDQLRGRVISAGETLPVFIPRFDANQKELQTRFDQDRFHIAMDVCYCSTLGDCWKTSRPAGREVARTEEAGRCPAPDVDSFQQ